MNSVTVNNRLPQLRGIPLLAPRRFGMSGWYQAAGFHVTTAGLWRLWVSGVGRGERYART